MASIIPPIHRIPTETLSHIFIFLLKEDKVEEDSGYAYEDEEGDDSEDEGSSDESSVVDPLSALLVRSVCRRWHAVAESTPELWVDLVGPCGSHWTHRALSLSKDCSLNLRVIHSDPTSYDPISFQSLLLKKYCFRSLFIVFPRLPDAANGELQALLSSPLPRLESLVLDGGSSVSDYPLGQSTFAGQIPQRLKILTLHCYPLLLQCPALHAPLTCLKLWDCPAWESMNSLLGTLSNLPQLKIFSWEVMDDDTPFLNLPLSASFEANPRLVHLPHMESINIRTEVERVTYLFAHVVIPTSCSISALSEFHNLQHDPIDDLYIALDIAFGERLLTAFPSTTDCQRSGFKKMSLCVFRLDYSAGATTIWREPTSTSGPATFRLGFLPLPEDDEYQVHTHTLSIISHILGNWPSTSHAVSQLHLHHNGFHFANPSHFTPENRPYPRLLGLLPSLEHIRAIDPAHGFFSAIAHPPREYLPLLRQLDLEYIDLSTGDYVDLVKVLKARGDISNKETSARPPMTFGLKYCSLGGEYMPDVRMTLGAY
ncbi:hypothetical protein PENSPDRAFT_659676 [Peniophora sp. CONT]|nr:hypothetical protein PENSPDRAFT_659676 [Peniophora sp. CONT]